METDNKTFRGKISSGLHMGQRPEDRLWSVVIVLAILVFFLGGILLSIHVDLNRAQSLSYERSATDCLDLLDDDDRDFDLPQNCFRPEVAAHYPLEVCVEYFPDISGCGSDWTDQ